MPHVTVEEELTLTVNEVKVSELRKDCYKLKFLTSRGTNQGILHHKEGCAAGTVLVGGTGGGFDGPASVYRDMGPDLLEQDIATLRLDYRRHAELEESILDVLAGIEYLKEMGIKRVGLVGWSFGGAVVITAGVISDMARAVVTIASQSYGTDRVDELSPKALLLLHGTGDRTLPPSSSEYIYDRARQPKEITFFEGANHGIDQNRKEMLAKVEDFLTEHLRR